MIKGMRLEAERVHFTKGGMDELQTDLFIRLSL